MVEQKRRGKRSIKNKQKKKIVNHLTKNMKTLLAKSRTKLLKLLKKNKESELKVNQEKKNQDEADFENGRLFVRNLCYTCKEEDLEKLFAPYGPLVEVKIPIDNFSKQLKGFAFVTCMFPEKALKAFNDLDGTIFQGRMLHILPSNDKNDQEKVNATNGTFKSKKDADLKRKLNLATIGIVYLLIKIQLQI